MHTRLQCILQATKLCNFDNWLASLVDGSTTGCNSEENFENLIIIYIIRKNELL